MTNVATTAFDRRFALLGQGEEIGRTRIVLVPGTFVPMILFDLPEAVTGHNREKVARRQMKDRMGFEDHVVEMRPFVMPGQQAWQGALISERVQVEMWRGSVGRVRAMLPDFLALPTCDGLWTIAEGAGGFAVRCGPADGFGADAAMLAPMAKERMAEVDAPKAVLALCDLPEPVRDLITNQEIPILTDPAEVVTQEGLSAPKTLGFGELALDLMQDPALTRTRLRRGLRAWITPLVLAVIGAGLWIAANITETRRLTDEQRSIAAATQEIVRARFVPEGPILDVRAQVTARLSALRTEVNGTTNQKSALDLFAVASPVLAQMNASVFEVVSDDGRRLNLVVDVADFAAADALQEALATEGLVVDMIEARVNDRDTVVRTRLAITGVAPG